MRELYSKFDGLIFDLDGTLADTMPTHFEAWSRSMSRHGLIFTEERFYELGGVPAATIIKLLAREQGQQVNVAAIADSKELLFLDLLGDVQPVPEVYAIADYYRHSLPMAVATGSPTWVAEKILKAMGVRDWFAAVVGAECVPFGKPAPDVYLLAAKLAGVDPDRCHAFEDTNLGMASARNAGMAVININLLRG